MADISQYLAAILSAVYGEDVRGSIHDAIEIINDVSEVVLSTGTAITDPTSSSTGFYEDSLYLNTNTYELWKCVGTDTWASQGILKGADGSPGVPGADGNRWYRGTGISGKAVNPTVYSGSGIADANPNDFYLNPSEGAVYHCVTGGDASTATWSYDFTMTGGGGGGSVVGWNQIQTSTGATKIAEITIDGTQTDVYAPQGGGSSTLSGLSDVNISSATNDQVLKYDSSLSKWVNGSAPASGHNMLDNSTIISGIKGAITEGTTNDDVVSGYGVGVWANTDTNIILSGVNQGDTEMGEWEDDSTWETGSRVGWLYHRALFKVLDTTNGVHIEPSFELQEHQNSGIGYVAYRIDDEIYQSTTPVSNPKKEGLYELSGTTYVLTNDETIVSGKTYYVGLGAGAIKFNAPIPTTGVQVGFVLTKLRTNVFRGITRSTS